MTMFLWASARTDATESLRLMAREPPGTGAA